MNNITLQSVVHIITYKTKLQINSLLILKTLIFLLFNFTLLFNILYTTTLKNIINLLEN